jgi:hypothetical protein
LFGIITSSDYMMEIDLDSSGKSGPVRRGVGEGNLGFARHDQAAFIPQI